MKNLRVGAPPAASGLLAYLALCLACASPAKASGEALAGATALDPQMARVLEEFQQIGGRSLVGLSLEAARKQPTLGDAAARIAARDNPSSTGLTADKFTRVDRPIPGLAGRINIHAFAPKDGATSHPILTYFHDGGWVIGPTRADEQLCARLAVEAGYLVVLPERRLAPENKWPAAVEDAISTHKWLAEHGNEIGGDNTRVAIGGEGTGASLAAVVAAQGREMHFQLPIHQLLVCPALQATDFNTTSYAEHANALPLGRSDMEWSWNQYLSTAEDGRNPSASPLLTLKENLDEVSPATVILAEADPLYSEGEAYITRLLRAQPEVKVGIYKGVTHGFFGLSPVLDKAREAEALAVAQLKAAASRKPYEIQRQGYYGQRFRYAPWDRMLNKKNQQAK